jgi:tRNA/tmRNA/rRNA uracil-C5-methylase (TrmA/RlmC/RlmD family)
MICKYAARCSGCDYWDMSLNTQKEMHLKKMQELVFEKAAVRFHHIKDYGLRDRLDFTFENSKFGLYDKQNKNEIIDLDQCLQLSPELTSWLNIFRKHLAQIPKVLKGSVRLRVGPNNLRGAWLDFSNENIKELLVEKNWLCNFPEDVIIEVGQKKKVVSRDKNNQGQLKLIEGLQHPWFLSKYKNKNILLFMSISDFSQPSLLANEWITNWFQEKVHKYSPARILEFGAGNGNLSFAVLSEGAELEVFEINGNVITGFKKSLEEFKISSGIDLTSNVKFHRGDFLSRPIEGVVSSTDAQMYVLNPPRSGLKEFLKVLKQAPRESTLLYMSCSFDGFKQDYYELDEMGYKLKGIDLLNQFPQTKHIEILSEWAYLQQPTFDLVVPR